MYALNFQAKPFSICIKCDKICNEMRLIRLKVIKSSHYIYYTYNTYTRQSVLWLGVSWTLKSLNCISAIEELSIAPNQQEIPCDNCLRGLNVFIQLKHYRAQWRASSTWRKVLCYFVNCFFKWVFETWAPIICFYAYHTEICRSFQFLAKCVLRLLFIWESINHAALKKR